MGKGGVVGHGGRPSDARVQFAKPQIAGFLVDQEIQFKIAAIAFLAQLFTKLEGQFTGLLAHLWRECSGKDFIAAPPTAIRGQFLETDQLGHQGANNCAFLGCAGLNRGAPAVDPLHDLDLALADDLGFMTTEVGFGFDKERGVAAVAKGGLQHQVMTDTGLVAGFAQIVVGFYLGQNVWHGRHTSLVADAHGFDLVVHRLAQFGLGEPDGSAQLLAQPLGFFVKHQEHKFWLAAAPLDEINYFLVLQQVVVDVLDRLEFCMGLFRRAEHVGMFATVAVDVADVFEILDPFIQAQQVEVGRRDEIDGVFVSVKEPADFRDILENSCHGIGPLRCRDGEGSGGANAVKRVLREHPQAQIRAVSVDFADIQRAHEIDDFVRHDLTGDKDRKTGGIGDDEAGRDNGLTCIHRILERPVQLQIIAVLVVIAQIIGRANIAFDGVLLRTAERFVKAAKIR